MKVPLLTCFITGVHDDGYGHGIAKVTMSASDPISCFTFMSKYFTVRCQDNQACHTSVTCGTPGRAALCGDKTCTMSTIVPVVSLCPGTQGDKPNSADWRKALANSWVRQQTILDDVN